MKTDNWPIEEMLDECRFECYMCQTQAAALAVLCADIRAGIESVESPEVALIPDKAVAILSALEKIAIVSINKNDGNVVKHIGHAARQMNPLLMNQD